MMFWIIVGVLLIAGVFFGLCAVAKTTHFTDRKYRSQKESKS